MHNKCIYVHDKIISYKTLYKNQQAMYKIISLSLWQQILATTISNHNTCDRSSSHGRACSGIPWGQLRETGLCIPICLYYISMLASSANIPDNIKWANTTANTWALRAVSLLAAPTNRNSRHLQPFSSAVWREDALSWKPSDRHLLLKTCFRPIFGLPFLVTKCRLLNQDLKTHASDLNTCARLRGHFVLWRGLMLYTELLGKLKSPDHLKRCSSSVQPNHLHSTFGKWYSCSLILQAKIKKMHPS